MPARRNAAAVAEVQRRAVDDAFRARHREAERGLVRAVRMSGGVGERVGVLAAPGLLKRGGVDVRGLRPALRARAAALPALCTRPRPRDGEGQHRQDDSAAFMGVLYETGGLPGPKVQVARGRFMHTVEMSKLGSWSFFWRPLRRRRSFRRSRFPTFRPSPRRWASSSCARRPRKRRPRPDAFDSNDAPLALSRRGTAGWCPSASGTVLLVVERLFGRQAARPRRADVQEAVVAIPRLDGTPFARSWTLHRLPLRPGRSPRRRPRRPARRERRHAALRQDRSGPRCSTR